MNASFLAGLTAILLGGCIQPYTDTGDSTDTEPLTDKDGDGHDAEKHGGDDCDDDDGDIHPDAREVCDDVDHDCDGSTDAGAEDAETFFPDTDTDDYGDRDAPLTACEAPSGYISDGTDCDDDDATAYPGAPEVCDGDDENCDEVVDEAGAEGEQTFYEDLDGDGYGTDEDTQEACEASTGWAAVDGDCDDSDPAVNPGAEEVCDQVDNDCEPGTSPDILVGEDALTITEALEDASEGDWICVPAGTYSESELIVNKSVHLEGEDQATTIIDGAGISRVLSVVAGSEVALIQGFTVTGGTGVQGAAIYVDLTDATFEDIIVEDVDISHPSADCIGGVVYISSSSPTFRRVTLRNNSVDCASVWGVLSIYGERTEITFENLSIIGNDLFASGDVYGALAGYLGQNINLTNVIIAGNTATSTSGTSHVYAGSFSAMNGSVVMATNVTITGNVIDGGGGGIVDGAVWFEAGATADFVNVSITDNQVDANASTGGLAGNAMTTLTHCNLSNNDVSDFSGIDDPTGVDGNISEPPQHSDTDGDDPTTWDLTLSETSALIDAGSTAFEDPDGTVSDIGAYGGQGAESW